ncbi:MAG TPA: iron ABC transporter substrate-binding protein [Herpetosiphonaceae bacterium]|nr:iron ABC transporter substrate-binding protein [Herpetosiphonaceae bacterium]
MAADATTNAATPEATAEAASTAATEAGTSATLTGAEITLYSGRNEELVGKLIEQFQTETGVKVNVRYGDTAELAAAIIEEGANTPADVFFSQDAGALGLLATEGRLQKLPDATLNRVEARFRSPEGLWVGASGRARVVVYNNSKLTEADMPESILDFTDPKWKGRLGWAPSNASFQAFVTALRVLQGEEQARQWLEGIKANEPKVYDGNTPIVKAVAAGEIDAGFVNHYYLYGQIEQNGEDFAASNHFLKQGDPGALINVAGAAVLKETQQQAAAEQFVDYLLSDTGQEYFAGETFEYPLVPTIKPSVELPPLETIQTPELDLSNLKDVQGTTQLLQDLGIL